MLLAEDLLLLLTDDATGKLLLPAERVDIALGGANLLERRRSRRATGRPRRCARRSRP
jgi:hypothetical protein